MKRIGRANDMSGEPLTKKSPSFAEVIDINRLKLPGGSGLPGAFRVEYHG